MGISYSDGFKQAADRVVELEKAGLDQVWIAEAYSFDAISQVGYLAAKQVALKSVLELSMCTHVLLP